LEVPLLSFHVRPFHRAERNCHDRSSPEQGGCPNINSLIQPPPETVSENPSPRPPNTSGAESIGFFFAVLHSWGQNQKPPGLSKSKAASLCIASGARRRDQSARRRSLFFSCRPTSFLILTRRFCPGLFRRLAFFSLGLLQRSPSSSGKCSSLFGRLVRLQDRVAFHPHLPANLEKTAIGVLSMPKLRFGRPPQWLDYGVPLYKTHRVRHLNKPPARTSKTDQGSRFSSGKTMRKAIQVKTNDPERTGIHPAFSPPAATVLPKRVPARHSAITEFLGTATREKTHRRVPLPPCLGMPAG